MELLFIVIATLVVLSIVSSSRDREKKTRGKGNGRLHDSFRRRREAGQDIPSLRSSSMPRSNESNSSAGNGDPSKLVTRDPKNMPEGLDTDSREGWFPRELMESDRENDLMDPLPATNLNDFDKTDDLSRSFAAKGLLNENRDHDLAQGFVSKGFAAEERKEDLSRPFMSKGLFSEDKKDELSKPFVGKSILSDSKDEPSKPLFGSSVFEADDEKDDMTKPFI